MAEPIIFYFDFVSGYSHLAAHRIDGLAAGLGRSVDWRCLSLPHVFKTLDHPFPASLKAKWTYALKDWARSCEIEGLPHAIPEVQPLDAKLARLVFWHLKGRDEARASAFATAVFDRYWGMGKDASTSAQLVEAGQAIGLDAATVAAGAGDAVAKQRIVTATEAAVAAGVFGAPFFFVDGEPFWGADRLPQMAWRLGGTRTQSQSAPPP